MAADESKFGWGKIRPSFLQWLNNPKWLLVFLCSYYLTLSMVINGTYSVSISTIEKRFGLSSSTTGLIASMYDIACLAVTAFVGYYGGQQRKARWLGTGLIVLALGNFIFILPHLIIGPYQPGKEQSLFPSLCQPNATNASHASCDSTLSTGHWYYSALFCIGMLVIGFGGSPMYALGIPYLDESVKKKVSPMYVGIFSSMAALGAAIGFGLGAVFLSISVDLDVDTSLNPSDSRWIGNWWMGCVILIVTSILLCPGMYGFPRVLPSAPGDNDVPNNPDDADASQDVVAPTNVQFTSLKDLIAATKTLFTSPSFLLISAGTSFEYFEVAAVIAFLPKIIQVVFNFPPAKVSLLFGIAIVVPGFVGQLVGSYVVKKLKLGAVGALKFVSIVAAVGIVVALCYPLTNCDGPEVLGVTKDFENKTFQTINPCGIPCDCNRWPYYPVCDGNITFWSPCHARCGSYLRHEKTFQGCECTLSKKSVVKPGKCPDSCGVKPILLLFIIAVIGFLICLTQTPLIIAILRSVPYRSRAYGIGWQLNLTRLLGTIPGPIIFGKLIDSVCIQWEQTCEGQGSCQEYNHWKLILVTTILMVTLKTITLICFASAWKIMRNNQTKRPLRQAPKTRTLVDDRNSKLSVVREHQDAYSNCADFGKLAPWAVSGQDKMAA